MTSPNRAPLFILVGACVAGLASSPAGAQNDPAEELDALAQASTEIAPGLALAREQAAGGDLVGAAATLERTLLIHPDADEARLMHASLLCRLDDPAGAQAELDQLAGRPISDRAWSEVTVACGAVQRPAEGAGTGGAASLDEPQRATAGNGAEG